MKLAASVGVIGLEFAGRTGDGFSAADAAAEARFAGLDFGDPGVVPGLGAGCTEGGSSLLP